MAMLGAKRIAYKKPLFKVLLYGVKDYDAAV